MCCCAASLFSLPRQAEAAKRVDLCSSHNGDAAARRRNAKFYALSEVNWNGFHVANFPLILEQCHQAIGFSQSINFTDDLSLHESWNSIDPDDPSDAIMFVGVGNLEVFPPETLIAVLLHEFAHAFSSRLPGFWSVKAQNPSRKIELLADVVAGGAFAIIQKAGLGLEEIVRGRCANVATSNVNNAWVPMDELALAEPAGVSLDTEKTVEKDLGIAKFKLLRADGTIEDVRPNNSVGPQSEDRSECFSTELHSIDFSAMVAAASAWRTFGDVSLQEQSHGTSEERFKAFSLGYNRSNDGLSLDQCFYDGASNLGVLR